MIDGKVVDRWVVRYPETEIRKRLMVDAAKFRSPTGLLIGFRLPDATSPIDLDVSSDARNIALGLAEISVILEAEPEVESVELQTK